MEDRRTRARKRLAGVREGIPDHRSPIDRKPKSGLNRESISCNIRGVQTSYQPGDLLMCNYVLKDDSKVPPSAIETSVIWRTCGKGQEDIGVHFFDRRHGKELLELDSDLTQKLTVRLPNTPLTYNGTIVQIAWCVRIRIFLSDGTQKTFDEEFRLGDTR